MQLRLQPLIVILHCTVKTTVTDCYNILHCAVKTTVTGGYITFVQLRRTVTGGYTNTSFISPVTGMVVGGTEVQQLLTGSSISVSGVRQQGLSIH